MAEKYLDREIVDVICADIFSKITERLRDYALGIEVQTQVETVMQEVLSDSMTRDELLIYIQDIARMMTEVQYFRFDTLPARVFDRSICFVPIRNTNGSQSYAYIGTQDQWFKIGNQDTDLSVYYNHNNFQALTLDELNAIIEKY